MTEEDKIREELSDLWCRKMFGQWGPEQQERLRQLELKYGITPVSRKKLLERLLAGQEFDCTEAYKDFHRQSQKRRTRLYILGRRIGVTSAAAVLLFMGIWTFWNKQKAGDLSSGPMVCNEWIEPGRSKAVITLSNGEQVILGNKKQQLQEKDGTLLKSDSTVVEYQKNRMAREEAYHTLSIPRGGEYRLVLADGTKVWMNADSKLRFPVNFTGEKREVHLQGEAYFEVTEDKKHPFQVHTSKGVVEVLGTGFNVRDYREEQKVVTTLVQGRVVYRPDRSPEKEVVLEPGFQLKDHDQADLQPAPVDVLLYTAWKDGKYIFENVTLEEIMQVLSKWYDIAVFYKQEEVKNLHFTGELERYEKVNDFLEFMEVGGNVRFHIKGRTVIVE